MPWSGQRASATLLASMPTLEQHRDERRTDGTSMHEANAIRSAIRAALGDRLGEIIMVDDGSTDESVAIMQTLGVCVISRPRNGGQSAAILTGLAAASGSICCVLDADLEDPPETLPSLLSRLDPVSARAVFSSRDEPRPLTSRLFRRAMRLLFPTLPAHSCLCFAVDAGTRAAIVGAATERDYLPAVIGALGVPTAQVTVRREPAAAGESGHAGLRRLRYAGRAFASALRIRWRARRRV